jgi:hypothetical protein
VVPIAPVLVPVAPAPDVVPVVDPFTLAPPVASGPNAEVEPLARVPAVASSVAWLRRSTVVVLVGATVEAVGVVVGVPADVGELVAAGLVMRGALVVKGPVVGRDTVPGTVAACATAAKTSATAAARTEVWLWRIAFSLRYLSKENYVQYACRGD